MIQKIRSFLGIPKPLSASPCPRCSEPSYDGVCPSCFQRGEHYGKQQKNQKQDRKLVENGEETDDDPRDCE